MSSFNRPTRAELDKRIVSDFEYELGSQAPRMPNTIERALVKAEGGVVHGLYGRLDAVYRNFFPHLADETGVIKVAALFGLTRKPATRARGILLLSGTNGVVVPAATSRWVRSDGTVYRILEDFTLTGGLVDPVLAEAVVSGAAGNCPEGTKMTLQSPLSGLQSVTEVGIGAMTGGVDREDWRALRERLLERLDNPPSGGGPGSYIKWAKEVSGVTRAWEFGKKPKLGHVTVLFLRDGDTNPFPDAMAIAAVEAKLLEYAPLHLAGLHVFAPNKYAFTVEIQLTPNTPEVQAAVRASIMAMLKDRASPASADGTPFYRSWISEAISTTPGEVDHKLNIPLTDIVLSQWDIAWIDDPLVNITFV